MQDKDLTIPADLGTIGQQIVQLSQQFAKNAQDEHDKQLKSIFALLPATMVPYAQRFMDHMATDLEYIGGMWVFVGEFLEREAQVNQNIDTHFAAGLHVQ